MAVEQIVWSMVSRVLAILLGPKLAMWLSKRSVPMPVKRWLSLREYQLGLPARLRRMPFIYAGIEADVLNDFVSIELDRIDPSTLDSKGTTAAFRLDPKQVLKDRRFVGIIGNAGIGKTTFQRHSILQLLNDSTDFLHDRENLVPLYVPLKVVPNAGPLPIQRYIASSAPFNGDVSFLIRMTRERGIFLCLDGYDEIALTGTSENFIQQELAFILYASPPEDRMHHDTQFYSALSVKSRVWITSRPQFIQHHPIGRIGSRLRILNTSVATIGIVGIGGNRESLARRVFERYSSTHVDVEHLLNAEYFLQHLDKAADGEIREMSFNPLFLTVMCYNYAQTVLRERRHDIQLGPTFDLLILECIDLLLIDIDDYKARQFSAAQRHAIENRRNQFIEEKRLFLRHLAGYAYLHNLNVFTERRLRDVLFEFLDTRGDAKAKAAISNTFENNASDRPSFVRQLIYCGLFVLIDTAGALDYFDFPHRRFREVLASKHFSVPSAYVQFLVQLSALGEAALVELVAVLRRSADVSSEEVQRNVLEYIFDEMISRSCPERDYVRVTNAFVDMLPPNCDVSAVVSKFIGRVMHMREPMFDLSARILETYQPERIRILEMEQFMRDRVDQGDVHGVSVGCSLMRFYSAAALPHTLKALLCSSDVPATVVPYLLRSLIAIDPEGAHAHFERALATCQDRFCLIDIVVDAGRCNDIKSIQCLWGALDEHGKMDMMLYVASTVELIDDRAAWRRFMDAVAITYDHDLIMVLRSGLDTSFDWDLNLYFVGSRTVELLGDSFEQHERVVRVYGPDDARIEERAIALRLDPPEPLGSLESTIGTKGPIRYASVSHEAVKATRGVIELNLRAIMNQFLVDPGLIHSAVASGIEEMYEQAKFTRDTTRVAFAGAAVFSKSDLVADSKRRVSELARWDAKLCRDVASAWGRIPLPVRRIPYYFVNHG